MRRKLKGRSMCNECPRKAGWGEHVLAGSSPGPGIGIDAWRKGIPSPENSRAKELNRLCLDHRACGRQCIEPRLVRWRGCTGPRERN